MNRNPRVSKEREELLRVSNEVKPNASSDTVIPMDHRLENEKSSLWRSHQGVDELLNTGSNLMSSLRNQRETLKGARRQILNVSNMLGMSNTVMRLIEKRAYGDKLVLFGGMFLFLLFMLLVYIYWL